MEAIASAPPPFRDAVVAIDVLGLSYAEAARHLKVPEATVTSRLYRGRRHVARTLVDDAETVLRLQDAHRALDHSSLEGEEKVCVALQRLVRGNATPTGPARRTTGADGRVAKVREILDDRTAENVGLDELAAAADISRFHLIRVFQRRYGLTPFAYQRNRRIEKARRAVDFRAQRRK